MGMVFMSVILHDMLFDVFCDPAPPSRHSGHRAGKKHTEGAAGPFTASHRMCSAWASLSLRRVSARELPAEL